jgi:acyl-CoA synthetase (NDP forming)
VDLAMIVVPAAEVLAAVDDCISKSVRAICVIKRGIQRVRRRGPRA